VISASGGRIQAGRAVAVFPAGVVVGDTAVVLRTAEPDASLGSLQKGRAFELDVASGVLCQPVSLSLSAFGGPDRTVLLALSDAVAGTVADDNAVRPALVSAQVTNGTLGFVIPPAEACSALGGASLASRKEVSDTAVATRSVFSFFAVSGYLQEQSSHFSVSYPSALLAQADDFPQRVLDYAEQAYDLLQAAGYDLSGLNYPFGINVLYNMGDRHGETAVPLSGKARAYINLNAALSGQADQELLKITLGHEFFHAVQNTYDPRSSIRVRHSWSKPVFLWLSEASSVWFESKMAGRSDYISSVFLDNIDMKYIGLETYGSNVQAQDLGYWASGFLRWLENNGGGEQLIRKAWEEVRKQEDSALEYSSLRALFSAMGSGVQTGEQWRNYMDALNSGTTGFAGWPLASTNRAWYAASGEVAARVEQLAPFSGQRWAFHFNELGEGNSYSAMLQTDDSDIHYSLYKAKSVSGPFTWIGSMQNRATMPIAVELGDVIIVSVVNTNTDSPFTARKTAAMRFGKTVQCLYCEGIPTNLVAEYDTFYGTYYVKHPSLGHVVAKLDFFDFPKTVNIGSVSCYDYNDGSCVSYSRWYKNGNLGASVGLDAECRNHGLTKSFYEDGSQMLTANYNHGLTDGLVTRYHDNGQLHTTCNYNNGKYAPGVCAEYKDTGVCIKYCIINAAGEVVSCDCP
jgi:hypothetical protein